MNHNDFEIALLFKEVSSAEKTILYHKFYVFGIKASLTTV